MSSIKKTVEICTAEQLRVVALPERGARGRGVPPCSEVRAGSVGRPSTMTACQSVFLT